MPRKPAKKSKASPEKRAPKSAPKPKKASKPGTSKTANKKPAKAKSTATNVKTTSLKSKKPRKPKTTASQKVRSTGKKLGATQTKVKPTPSSSTQPAKKTTSKASKPEPPKHQSKQSKSAPLPQKSTALHHAKTIKTAFKYFRAHTVDLHPSITQKGRSSQTFLVKQIKQLARRYSDFPKLKGNYVPFGSFSRNVKINPLDDIDLLILLNGSDTTISPTVYRSSMVYTVTLKKKTKSTLASFANEQGQVNSTKVLNRIKAYLTHVTHYQKASTNKRMQAVTFQLKSYPWVFDIVPAIPVCGYGDRVTHYLIPDGHGNWISTNPKIDAQNMAIANKEHQGKLLAVMRLLKYWNNRTHKPRLPSYYFETLVIQTFRHAAPIKSDPEALEYFFHNVSIYLMSSCPDPKSLGGNLDNGISRENKEKVAKALKTAAQQVRYAIMAEAENDPKKAISWWRKIFGTKFPSYG